MTKLTSAFIRTAKPGRYSDGGGLILQVKSTGSRSWLQRVVIHGKRRDIGLGPLDRVGLAKAREIAASNRAVARAGGDPTAVEEPKRMPSFAEAFEQVLDLKRPRWKHSSKSEGQWRASYRDYMKPLANMPVDEIKMEHILKVLTPIWHVKAETARRVKQRIGEVLEWACLHDYRPDNPAQRVGKLLGANVEHKQHFRAVPYDQVAEVIRTVRESDAWPITKLAIEFTVLTAARSGETRGATWNEIDGDVWIVPAERMKAGKMHRVPLSGRALEVLDEAKMYRGGDLIFPSLKTGRALSDNSLSKLLRELGIGGTIHGMRSAFRQWAAEQTSFPREIAELALAHANRDRVESAYQRSDLLDRRRELMSAWAMYLTAESADIVVLDKVRTI